MIKSRLLVWLCVPAILFCSGCSSFRVLTDLKPEADANLQSPAGRFYIAGLKYLNDSGIIGVCNQEYEKNLLLLVRKECLARYSSLFARNVAGGIPIWIDVSDSNSESDKTLIWMLCTMMILPMPAKMDRAIAVDVGVWNGSDSIAGEKIRQEFRREEYAWTSLTPAALFPIPGKSDLPKESGFYPRSPSRPFNNRVGYYDVPQVAQQVATAIAKLVAPKDPGFWTTQPQLNNSPVGLPTRTGDVQVAPPLPTDSVAPF